MSRKKKIKKEYETTAKYSNNKKMRLKNQRLIESYGSNFKQNPHRERQINSCNNSARNGNEIPIL